MHYHYHDSCAAGVADGNVDDRKHISHESPTQK